MTPRLAPRRSEESYRSPEERKFYEALERLLEEHHAKGTTGRGVIEFTMFRGGISGCTMGVIANVK